MPHVIALAVLLVCCAVAYAKDDEPMVDIPVLGLVFTQRCYDIFLTNGLLAGSLDIFDMPCIKITISKGLSWGIVIFSGILKVPQIYKIVSSGNVAGISASAFYFDLFGYLVTPVYGWMQGFPFSTYGETFPILAQNIALVLLYWFYAKGHDRQGQGTQLAVVGLCVGAVAGMFSMPQEYRSVLPLVSTGLIVYSRVPQIRSNIGNGHTGQLSIATWGLQTLGATARVFTTWAEVDDRVFLASTTIAAALSFTLCVQVVYYRESTKKAMAAKSD